MRLPLNESQLCPNVAFIPVGVPCPPRCSCRPQVCLVSLQRRHSHKQGRSVAAGSEQPEAKSLEPRRERIERDTSLRVRRCCRRSTANLRMARSAKC
jgi:hypothetical protein